MSIQEAIEKAIAGGWGTANCGNCQEAWIGHKPTRIGNRYCKKYPDMLASVLDPEFWQCLGKGLGNKEEMRCINSKCDSRQCEYAGYRDPKRMFDSFTEAIWSGRSIEDFFKELT